MKKLSTIMILASLGLASSAMAQGGTSFGTAVTAQPGTVNGTLSAAVVSETLLTTLVNQQRVAGSINDHLFIGLSAGAGFRAAMRQSDNGAGGLTPTWDSFLRVRDTGNTTTLASDDDSGPGALSAMTTSISTPANGELRVQVTGFSDRNTFTGADSTNVGFYDLDVFQTSITTPGVSVQWYRFENLGGLITGDVANIAGISDSMLMLFDSSGNTIFSDDDDGAGLLSAVLASDNLMAPADGVIYAAVTYFRQPLTSFSDPASYNNIASSNINASFTLTLVPAPGAMALLGLGGLVATRRRRA